VVFKKVILNNLYSTTLATMKSKPTSVWKRYQSCGGVEIFGTQCYIDEMTESEKGGSPGGATKDG
jgi:hypothetical protein